MKSKRWYYVPPSFALLQSSLCASILTIFYFREGDTFIAASAIALWVLFLYGFVRFRPFRRKNVTNLPKFIEEMKKLGAVVIRWEPDNAISFDIPSSKIPEIEALAEKYAPTYSRMLRSGSATRLEVGEAADGSWPVVSRRHNRSERH